MELQQAILLINDALRGVDDEAPNSGTEDYLYWVRVLNRKKNELYSNASKTWRNTYDVKSAGTIAASSSPTYSLNDSFIAPSGSKYSSGIYVVTTAGQRVDLELINPQDRATGNQVFIGGLNPQKLYFTGAIDASSPLVGGMLYVSGYYMPSDISEITDKLPFPDPYWGIMATAAEIAGNDIVYEDKEANLVAKANSLYTQMERNNSRGVPGAENKTKTSVKRIRGF